VLNLGPENPDPKIYGYPINYWDDQGLCNFVCQRGDYCPPDICASYGNGPYNKGASTGSITGTWTSKHCDDPEVSNQAQPPAQRWSDLGCDDAWGDWVTYWPEDDNIEKQKGWSTAMFDYFKGNPQDLSKFNSDSDSCDPGQCQEPGAGADKGPAGWMILSSVCHVHKVRNVPPSLESTGV
jgi:hypothetical protein